MPELPEYPPITDAEREGLRDLHERLHAEIWWADSDPQHSWRLFRASRPTDHGLQVLKAPTSALAGDRFQAYWPTQDEGLYIVAALNAIPRYEALVHQLQAELDARAREELPDGDTRRE